MTFIKENSSLLNRRTNCIGSINLKILNPSVSTKIELLGPMFLLVSLIQVKVFWYFNNLILDIITVILYKSGMRDENFFLHPVHEWQRRYEALRASFVDRLPAKVVADRFGYSVTYINLLRHLFSRHLFSHEKIDFSEPVPEGKTRRHRIDATTRTKICNWREHRLSAGEITQLLSEEGVEVSVRTVERILAEEGYPRLPRRTRLKLGMTVKGARVPATAQQIRLANVSQKPFESEAAGVFLFAPFIEKLNLAKVVQDAGLPGSAQLFYVVSCPQASGH